MADIIPYLERICARFDQPDVRSSFHGFARTLLFTFPDLGRDFTLSIDGEGSAKLEEQSIPQPDVKVTTASDTLAGILDRTVNPIHAYMVRKLKVTGKMDDLLRLQKLL